MRRDASSITGILPVSWVVPVEAELLEVGKQIPYFDFLRLFLTLFLPVGWLSQVLPGITKSNEIDRKNIEKTHIFVFLVVGTFIHT